MSAAPATDGVEARSAPDMRIRSLAGAAVAVAVIIGALAHASPARAATGTLDTGALTPQTSSSRVAAEIENTGAAARKGHDVRPPETGAEAAAGVPRTAGHVSSKGGRERPAE